MSTDLFKAHIDSEERRIGDVEADVAEIKKDNAARATREQAREDDQRRAKAGLYASVALGVAAIAASFIVPFIHGGA
ncbi:hypothetical protein P9139_18185 [Curtobacterium flaccumfaciens]|nr:hypothetical protein P9139_18185 [Curtobacterium flaccumfaciens]